MTETTSQTITELTKPEPQEQHRWLERLVGDWTWEVEPGSNPDKPDEKHHGTESVRSLDGIWIVGEGRSDSDETNQSTSIITLGYDPKKKRFVGTFISSMMTDLWIYEGNLDASRNALVLEAEGPSFTDPEKRAQYRDTILIVDENHRTMTSAWQGDDGKWNEFMTMRYRRKA